MASQAVQLSEHQDGEEEVVEYISQMGPAVHPAFGAGLQYQPKTRKWRMQDDSAEHIDYQAAYAECFAARDAFLATANRYLKKVHQPPVDVDADDNDWTAVEASVERACAVLDAAAARDKDASGFSGKLKKGFQALCRSAKVGRLFTELIPENLVYTAPLRVGLNIIFRALEQTAEYRSEVCDVLERLPGILDNYDYLEVTAEDEKLHRLTARLYASVTWTLNTVLQWFVTNTFVAGTKRLFNPSGFSGKLHDRLKAVELAAADFKSYASRLMLKRQDEMFQIQGFSVVEQAKLSQDVDQIGHNIRKLNNFVEKDLIYTNIRAAFDSLQPFLQHEMKRLILENIGPGPPPPRRIDSLPTDPLTPDDLLAELLYDRSLVPADVAALLALGSAANPAHLDPDRVLAAQKNPRLLAWLSLDAPALLLVNGAAEPTSQSVSFVAAKVVRSLLLQDASEAMELVALAYFCGRHWDYRRDEAGSPDEMAMSLLLQLVDQYRRFEPKALQECLDKAVPHDVVAICDAFGALLARLPSTAVVYLVIDGLHAFSTPPERQRQMREVVELLVGIYRRQSGPVLKFLFSGPTRSAMEELFEAGEIVDLPHNPPPQGGYGLSWWQNPL